MASMIDDDYSSRLETPFMKQIDKIKIKNLPYPLTKSTLLH